MHTAVKWSLVKSFLLLGLFFGLQGITIAQNTPVVTAGTVSNAVPGQQVTIPISVANFRNIGSASLSLDYDPTKLQLISTTLNSSLGGSSSYGDNAIATDKHRLILGWYSVAGKTFSDGTVIVTYVFKYLAGNPSLQWYDDGQSCNFTNLIGGDLIDTPTSTYYKNSFVCAALSGTVSITGTNSLCKGVSDVDYSVSLDPTFTYNWSYSGTGATIIGTTNAVKISFSAAATSGTLTVKATNACGNLTTGTKDITLNSLQSPTFTSGPANIEIHSTGNVYTTQPGKINYTWSVTGGTITSGGTSSDNSATITWKTIGNQSVSVKYEDPNACMSSSPTVYPVIVNRTVLTITGVTVNPKIYDGTVNTSLNTSSASLTGVFGSEVVTLNTTGVSGTYDNKNRGNGKTVTTSGFTLGGTNAGNYSLTQPVLTGDITPKNLTISGISASDKTYDRTNSANLSVGTAVLSGLVLSDQVTMNFGSATGTFSDYKVGTTKQVTTSGFGVTGTDAANYMLIQPVTSADITPKSLTITGVSAKDKTYDGSVTANLNNLESAALSGLITGDNVTFNHNNLSAVFSDKKTGLFKLVTTTGFTLSGTDASNYVLTQPVLSADINAKSLNITGVSVDNKVYDGTNSASLNTSSAALVGVVSGDNISLIRSGVTGTFADKNVGSNKSITTSGLSISGTDATNYTLTQPNLTGNISPVPLTVSGVTANNKNYDGSTTATLNTGSASLVGIIGSDGVTLGTTGAVGTFASKDAASGITVTTSGFTLDGASAGNYILIQPTTIATISPLGLAITIEGVTVANKVYDGNTNAPLNTTNARMVGVIVPDVVILSTPAASGNFTDKNVGIDKPVVTNGFSISGANSGNYILMQPVLKANITPKNLTISGITANNKNYDGNTTATLNTDPASLVGVIGSDAVTLGTTGAVGTFASKDAASEVIVTTSGFSLDGANAGNYLLIQPTTIATISPLGKTITIENVTANNKVYDGTTIATINTTNARMVGVIAPDVVTLSSSAVTGNFTDKNIGIDKSVVTSGFSIGGANAGNYTLMQPVLKASISTFATPLTITGVTTFSKTYNGNTIAILNKGSAVLNGKIANDDVTLNTNNAFGSFADKKAGLAKQVSTTGFTITGTDANNYSLTQPVLTADITPKNLTISGITANNKTYDGTTTTSLITASGNLIGVFGTDSVSLVSSYATGVFVDKNVGSNKSVTPLNLSISGADVTNYTLTQPVLTANILPKPLIIKANDGSKCSGTNYSFTGNSFTVDGLANIDTIYSVNFSSNGVDQTANAGIYEIIAGNAIGTRLTNYTTTYVKGVLTINPIANQPADFLISSSTVCLGTTGVVYTIPKDSLVTYNWNYTGKGVTINGKTNSASLDFSQNASSGILSVIATTSCGISAPRKIDITVNTLNIKPVISFSDNTLYCNIGTGIQWYRNMTPIQGATSQSYIPVENGKYFIVCKTICISDTSNYVDVLISNIEQYMNNSTLQLFPNPAREYFILRSTTPMNEPIKLSIFSSDCILVRIYEINNKSFSKECQIDIRQLKPGLYFIRIESGQTTTTKKLIIL